VEEQEKNVSANAMDQSSTMAQHAYPHTQSKYHVVFILPRKECPE
jgi:hypothetical protein